MALAIIETGGKQYIVSPGSKIKVEKIKDKRVKDEIVFDKVLLFEEDGKVKIGTPFLEKIKVTGTIIDEDRNKKIIILKFRPKTRYKVKKGHRQPFMKVRVKKIED